MQVTIADLENAALDCETIAAFATSTDPTVTDREGNTKLTLQGALEALGYIPPVAYANGLSMTSGLQTVEYSGAIYAAKPSELPFTTSGTFESAKFRLINTSTATLPDDTVSTPKIQDEAVTADKLAPTLNLSGKTLSLPAVNHKGRLVDVQSFFTAGSATWTKPSGLSADAFVVVVVQAAGGGSVSATSSSSQCGMSAAGGAGGYAEVKMNASILGSTEPVSVGAGASGADGGNTTFGTLAVSRITAVGGKVHNSTLATGTSVAAAPRNGYGGACTTVAGDMLVNKRGVNGINGLRLSGSSAIRPLGGVAPLSSATPNDMDTSVSVSVDAAHGEDGSGASGAVSINGVAANGGYGGDGFVIVYTFA